MFKRYLGKSTEKFNDKFHLAAYAFLFLFQGTVYPTRSVYGTVELRLGGITSIFIREIDSHGVIVSGSELEGLNPDAKREENVPRTWFLVLALFSKLRRNGIIISDVGNIANAGRNNNPMLVLLRAWVVLALFSKSRGYRIIAGVG